MYQTDYDEFKKTLSDLCVSVNRPFNDDLCRVFWDDLKGAHLSEVRERAKYVRACGKTRFTAHDLRPEREPPAPANTYTAPDPSFDDFHRFGQRCLMKFATSYGGTLSAEQMRDLVEEKNRLVSDFRAMHREDEVTAEQMREALFRAFERIPA
jgi:hypothetical protein